MIAAVMAFSNLLLTQQTYSAERNGAHAHNRDLVPLMSNFTKSYDMVPLKFSEFYCVFTILVRFYMYSLGFPWEKVFGVITANLLYL